MPGRPAKRIKVDDGTVSVANHPLNVRPLGNAFVAEYNLKHTASAGLFGWLPDELLMQILGSLGPEDLCSISATSRCMYAYSHSEELWRPLFTRLVSWTTGLIVYGSEAVQPQFKAK